MRRFHGDDGASLVEYALLVALIVIVALVGVSYLGDMNRASLDDSSSQIGVAYE
jgi:Flp pilus assembly pilin Flp